MKLIYVSDGDKEPVSSRIRPPESHRCARSGVTVTAWEPGFWGTGNAWESGIGGAGDPRFDGATWPRIPGALTRHNH